MKPLPVVQPSGSAECQLQRLPGGSGGHESWTGSGIRVNYIFPTFSHLPC